MRYVIIGGDAAGMSAASKAKRINSESEVIVLEKTSDVSYSACGMPYNLADPDREMDDLIVRSPQIFRERQGIDLRLGYTVGGIDRHGKKVVGYSESGDFSIDYDKLLIATGARARKLTIPGNDLPGVLTLRSLEDGRILKSYLETHDVQSVLIIGSGYIGLEVAEAFYERRISTTLMDIRTELLPWMPHEMSGLIKEELESKHVCLMLGQDICEIKRPDETGKLVVITRETEFEVDLVLVGIGVEPRSELAAEAQLELGPFRSIAVDHFLRTSDPDIYAAGDCADAYHAITGQKAWIPLALRANRSGWIAAENAFANKTEAPGIIGTSVFKVMDYETARTGLSLGEATQAGFSAVETFIKTRSRAHAHPGSQDIYVHLVGDKKTGRLLGGNILGKEGAAHRINAIAVAIHAGMTVKQFSECDLAYAPPFSPVWDPMLTCANQLLKVIGS